MRIAMLADAGSVHTVRWVQGLARAGLSVAVWSDRAPRETLPGAVFPIPVAGRGRWNVPAIARQVRRELDAFRPDVVHAHYVSRYGLYGALAGRRPLVLSAWGADVEVFPQRHPWLNARLLKWILAQADRITASSAYLAGVTQAYTDQPITVIPFGIDLARFTPRPPGTGVLRWMTNKALEPVYGLDLIVEAWAQVPRTLAWTGRVLGEGSELARLQRLISRCGLADRIAFSGRVSTDALPDALAWADVGLYPSRRESFGVAPLEMMALGRAVVAHDVGGLSEVVAPGRSGILVTANDVQAWATVLADACRNPDGLREMGKFGPGWVAERYNFAENLSQMIEVYQRAVAGTRSRKGKNQDGS
ncbi:MAG: glycosyltransferase family 4 protein [Thermaerobacter sp.]|nr:glycosyltransferase family 4 protein [Thermaerobacter sp.]